MLSSPNDEVSQTLNFGQVQKLNEVLNLQVDVNGAGNFPTLQVRVNDLVQRVIKKLSDNNIPVTDVRLNGSAASYVVACKCNHSRLSFNDIDLIFSVNLEEEQTLLKIKDLVVETVLCYMPTGTNTQKLSICSLTEAYVSKLTKVWNPAGDKWSLVTLSNCNGMNIELKFVDTMKRKFQFSVDSFQIILNSMMQFYDVSKENMSEDFYPSVVAESVFGNFKEAVRHLNHGLIATHSPEDIRGGGLLKYCELLCRGYKPTYNLAELESMEKLMCSRFFIDYPDVMQQYQKLDSYIINHFAKNFNLILPYLSNLYRVVNNSTVCLMGHERRLALDLIQQVSYQVQADIDMQYFGLSMEHCHMGIDETHSYSPNYYHSYGPAMPMYMYPSSSMYVC